MISNKPTTDVRLSWLKIIYLFKTNWHKSISMGSKLGNAFTHITRERGMLSGRYVGLAVQARIPTRTQG